MQDGGQPLKLVERRVTRRKRSRSDERDHPRNIPVILHQEGGQGGHPEWRRTIWYVRNGGAPLIEIEYYDNWDDPGRPPAFHQTTSKTLADFLATSLEDDPAVVAYRRLVAEGHIEAD